MTQHRRAFTLIELLVVIAIIALLVSILMPSLHKTKLVANATVCASNLRNITMSIFTYAADNDEYAMPAWESDTKIWWTDLRSRFVKSYLGGSDQIFVCPSAGPPYDMLKNGSTVFINGEPMGRFTTPSTNRRHEDPKRFGMYFDYTVSAEFTSPEWLNGTKPVTDNYWPPVRLSQRFGDIPHYTGANGTLRWPGRKIGTPADKVHLLFDGRQGGEPVNYDGIDAPYATHGDFAVMKSPRHLDGYTANVAYVDGHVNRFSLLPYGPPTIPR
ncbi:MAG: type II secretion system GspH family protein [Phycisphaerae bacterium]|nr:type II secretion system GspH family protein [Phycisphaerae bacterium]